MKTFFGLYYTRLSWFASLLITDQQAAQDFGQEALVSLWQRRETFRHSTLQQAESFLFTVVRNKCYNHYKHEKVKAGRENDLLSGPQFDTETEARLIQEDLFNRVYKEIEQLPPAQARLMKMIFVDGLETEEIAKKLAITPNNVRNQKARALEKIRALLLRKRLLGIFFNFF